MAQSLFPTAADKKQAHRWFAVEYNNQAWDLLDQPNRSPDDNERLIALAHAAYLHWLEAGDQLNEQRAWCLLATCYTLGRRALEGVRAAEHCLRLAERNGDQQTPFDRATAHGCAALAFGYASMVARASEQANLAAAAADQLEEDDRAVFSRYYGLHRSRAAMA